MVKQPRQRIFLLLVYLHKILEQRKCERADSWDDDPWNPLLDEIERAAEHGILLPFRWNSNVVDALIRNREATRFDGRPIATLVYNQDDWNGAFVEHDKIIEWLGVHDYCVMFYESSTEDEVISALHNATKRSEESRTQPAKVIILGANSRRTLMNFGTSEGEEYDLDLTDFEKLLAAGVAATLEQGGQLILIACSAGAGQDKVENIVNMLRRVFAQAKEKGIWSAQVPTNIRLIVFDPDTHEVTEVRFDDERIYQP